MEASTQNQMCQILKFWDVLCFFINVIKRDKFASFKGKSPEKCMIKNKLPTPVLISHCPKKLLFLITTVDLLKVLKRR